MLIISGTWIWTKVYLAPSSFSVLKSELTPVKSPNWWLSSDNSIPIGHRLRFMFSKSWHAIKSNQPSLTWCSVRPVRWLEARSLRLDRRCQPNSLPWLWELCPWLNLSRPVNQFSKQQISITTHNIYLCSKEVTELIWGGNLNFSIYGQRKNNVISKIFLIVKNPT